MKICHLADIHIRKIPTRNDEYRNVFEKLYKSLKKENPDRIVIVGDLVNDYLNLQGEQIILVYEFLVKLNEIAPVRITRGNHDYLRSNNNRIDSIEAIIKTLNNKNIVYYNKTGFYEDDNVVWCVWHHGEQKNNPWASKEGKKINKNRGDKTYIDLFHDPINGCRSSNGFELKSKVYYRTIDFLGDYSFFGDIHLQQYLTDDKTKAYCGSLVQQDFSEGDDNFHGYLIWDTTVKTINETPIIGDYSFKNIKISQYSDFDDLDFEIENPSKYMKIRIIWNTLSQTRTKENERKITEYIKLKYSNVVISHKNEFIENEKIKVNENITLKNIVEKSVQHEFFTEYIEKKGVEKEIIEEIITLDEEIIKMIDIDVDSNIEWNIIKFGAKNFMSYEEFDIDWRDKNGLFQIVGKNTAGKTTIYKVISYILFGKTLETETRLKNGDLRYVNNRNGATSCDTYMIIEANGEYFGIKRKTEITRSRDGVINGAPTSLSYYLLNNPDDNLDEITIIENLDEIQRTQTQKKIESIVGSYNNFMRIVLTTSDTLNKILSNDMAVFIDSLLFDSGLDIFDKKLEGLKLYQKKINDKSRIICNIEVKTNENIALLNNITILNDEIKNIETIKIPKIQERLDNGNKYIEEITKKLFEINKDTYNLNKANVLEEIKQYTIQTNEINEREGVLKKSIITLKDKYDEDRLANLIIMRENHKTNEFNIKLQIK